MMAMSLSEAARNLNWLVENFEHRVQGVVHAVVVSSDGLLIAASSDLDRPTGDNIASVTSGLASLVRGAATHFHWGNVRQTIVEMEHGIVVVMSIGDGSILAVLATSGADIELIGYEMVTLVARVGSLMTPALRDELHAVLSR
jgi:predicted regulator of Ras-like GTPase activity (Roadblock/LC7/MglB family)